MSWINWFTSRPHLKKEVDKADEEETDLRAGVLEPSAPPSMALHQSDAPENAAPIDAAANAAPVINSDVQISISKAASTSTDGHAPAQAAVSHCTLPAMKQSPQKMDADFHQRPDSVAVEAPAVDIIDVEAPAVDTIDISTSSAAFEDGAGHATEIQASAEIVEEALAVAHTVFSETCGDMATSSSSVPDESFSCTSGVGPRDEKVPLCGDVQSDAADLPMPQDEVSCRALVPCPAAEEDRSQTRQFFSCILNLEAQQAPGLDVRQPAAAPGPDAPSVEELLAYREPHDILGVPRDANSEILRRAYHSRARAFHPDKHRGNGQDIDRAFTQAFMLITRAYMTLMGGDVHRDRLQILNKVDLRRDRPVEGWAVQQKYDEKKRERLTRAEKALLDARREVSLAQEACAQNGEQTLPKEARAQQRRLTRANLALTKAEATVQAEIQFYQIEQEKDRERIMKRLQKAERAKEASSAPRPPAKRQRREAPKNRQGPEDIMAAAARLEAQAEEMKKYAADLRAQAQQGAPVSQNPCQVGTDVSQGRPPAKRRLVIQGCSSGATQ